MNSSDLCVCAEIYNEEALRLCRAYLRAVDAIIPFEGEIDGDINTLYNQLLLHQLKAIAKYIPDLKDAFESFRKRIYFLEVRGVSRKDDFPKIENQSEDFERANRIYNHFTYLFALKKHSIYEVSLPADFIDGLDEVSYFEFNTMVGALRDPRQFGVCLKRKFYHIPAKYVEEYPIPEYVAIYQSGRLFGRELAGIKYYGQVKKCIPVRRSRIRELPKSSNELYYKFKVKEWKRLENPIQARELGFVRLFTSISLLLNAKEVPELTLTNKKDFILYRLMYLADKELRNNPERIFVGFKFDGFELIFSAELIYLSKGEKILEKYRYSSFLATPSVIFQKIKEEMKKTNNK